MPYIDYDEVAAICRECGRNFRSEEDLQEHMEEVHEPARPEVAPVKGPAPSQRKRATVVRPHGRRLP